MRVAVLIISSDEKERWILEKSIWKQYMNSHKEVDCFFLETDLSIPSKSVKVSENLIKVGCEDGIMKGIFRKTILALQHLENKYDFYIRTNLSTFWRFNLLLPFLHGVYKKDIFYGGWAWKQLTQNSYISGFSIIINKKVCSLLVKEGLKHYEKAGQDDVIIGRILLKVLSELYTGGCTTENASNFNPSAQYDDGSCVFSKSVVLDSNKYALRGCLDSRANNYNPNKEYDDGKRCIYATPLNDKCFYWGQEVLPLKDAIKKIKCDNRFIIRTHIHSSYTTHQNILHTLLKEFKN
jgi:hypothetical protein